EAGDDPGADRLVEAEGASQHDGERAYGRQFSLKRGGWQTAPVDLHERKIGVSIRGHHTAAHATPVSERDLNRACAIDDVVVREDHTVGTEYHAAADARWSQHGDDLGLN